MLGGVKSHLEYAYSIFPFHDFACPCCGIVVVTKRLVLGHCELCGYVDSDDIVVHRSGGYRCAEHNLEVGGSPTSRHPLGEAIDYHINGLSLRDMYRVARQIKLFRGVGVYKEWNSPGLHSDVRRAHAEWEQVNGVYRKGISWTN